MKETHPPKKQTKQPSIHAGHRQRLKKQFLEHGAESFQDHQLLELLLFYVVPQRDTNPIAHELLRCFGSLDGVFSASSEELTQVTGITENGAILLRLLPELQRRISVSRETQQKFSTIEDVAEYLWPFFQGIRQERAYLLCLNQRDQIVGCDLLAQGNEKSVNIDPSLLVELALRHKANWVVMAHSHPSSFAIPSESDLYTTLRCRDVLKALNITLRDHLIFADDDYLSMKQSNML